MLQFKCHVREREISEGKSCSDEQQIILSLRRVKVMDRKNTKRERLRFWVTLAVSVQRRKEMVTWLSFFFFRRRGEASDHITDKNSFSVVVCDLDGVPRVYGLSVLRCVTWVGDIYVLATRWISFSLLGWSNGSFIVTPPTNGLIAQWPVLSYLITQCVCWINILKIFIFYFFLVEVKGFEYWMFSLETRGDQR